MTLWLFRVLTLHSYRCYVPHAIIYIGVKKEFQRNSNGDFARIEQNISVKSSAIEENVIKPSRFKTFQHLKVICRTCV